MKVGDLGSGPSFAVIFEFLYLENHFIFWHLNCLMFIMRQLNKINFFTLESTEKVIKIQQLFPASYKA